MLYNTKSAKNMNKYTTIHHYFLYLLLSFLHYAKLFISHSTV